MISSDHSIGVKFEAFAHAMYTKLYVLFSVLRPIVQLTEEAAGDSVSPSGILIEGFHVLTTRKVGVFLRRAVSLMVANTPSVLPNANGNNKNIEHQDYDEEQFESD